MKIFEKDSFRVIIDESTLFRIESLCKNHVSLETGGIIVGYYSPDQLSAIIKNITGAPPDSKQDRTNFKRGICGLKSMLIKLWKQGEYYLGEWHYHPKNSPIPSIIDIRQMNNISQDTKFKCPEPILIIAGDVNGYFEYSVSVFKNGTCNRLPEVQNL